MAIEYRIEPQQGGPWWWRQTLYFIVTDWGRFGPFETSKDAERGLVFLLAPEDRRI